MTIDRSDIANGDYDDDVTLEEVRQDIRDNFYCYTVCSHPSGGLEIGHSDEGLVEEDPSVVVATPSAAYTWMGY
tara:strand:- start:145 stop:366 length:222 start_codon:yes stop_codon:yes gene_type:complete